MFHISKVSHGHPTTLELNIRDVSLSLSSNLAFCFMVCTTSFRGNSMSVCARISACVLVRECESEYICLSVRLSVCQYTFFLHHKSFFYHFVPYYSRIE